MALSQQERIDLRAITGAIISSARRLLRIKQLWVSKVKVRRKLIQVVIQISSSKLMEKDRLALKGSNKSIIYSSSSRTIDFYLGGQTVVVTM